MRFTPTTKYLVYANAASKNLTWNVYMRITSSLSGSLSASDWTNVTHRITDIPDMPQKIEYSVGQFTSDAIDIDAKDIQYWKTNWFDSVSGTSQLIECKVELTLGMDTDTCTDIVYTFSGWVDLKYSTSELDDTISFTVYTADQLGERIIAENLSTQYIIDDIDGNGTRGLFLHSIPSMFIKDASYLSAPLKVGSHTISYEYDAGLKRAKLDDGELVTLTNGNNLLKNSDNTEQVLTWVDDVSLLSSLSGTEHLIVQVANTTLPKQWYRNAGARYLLTNIYSQLGITDVSFDELSINTALSGNKVSFIDNPPNDGSVIGKKWAMTTDGTNLYLAVGHKIYKRSASSEAYTNIMTLTANDRVSRMWYSQRNGHLWAFFGNTADDFGANLSGNGKIARWVASSSSTAWTDLRFVNGGVTNATWHNSIELYDYNFTGSLFKYGMVYTDVHNYTAGGVVKFLDGHDFSSTAVVSGSAYGYVGTQLDTIVSEFLYLKHDSGVFNGKVQFKGLSGTGSSYRLHELQVNSSGVWVNNGTILSNLDSYTFAGYHPTEDRVYYWEPVGRQIQSHLTTSNMTTVNLYDIPIPVDLSSFVYLNGVMYFTVHTADPFEAGRYNYLYGFSGNESHSFQDYPELSNLVHCVMSGMTTQDGRIYGIDVAGRLWQYHNTLKFYVQEANYADTSVRDALNNTLRAFNLVGKISSTKRASVYRRGNSDGVPQTTGNTLTITVANAGDITEDYQYGEKIGFASLSNGTDTVTFDGTSFNVKQFLDVKSLEVTNELIPTEIIEDLVFYMFQFFKTDRTMYSIPLNKIPMFQFEPFDGASITFTSTKIRKVGSGPLYTTTLKKDGSMLLEVLI